MIPAGWKLVSEQQAREWARGCADLVLRIAMACDDPEPPLVRSDAEVALRDGWPPRAQARGR